MSTPYSLFIYAVMIDMPDDGVIICLPGYHIYNQTQTRQVNFHGKYRQLISYSKKINIDK